MIHATPSSFQLNHNLSTFTAPCSLFLFASFSSLSALAQEPSNSTNVALPVLTSPLSDPGLPIFRVLSALALVLALFFAGVWLTRNWQRLTSRQGPGTNLRVLEIQPLGNRQTLWVLAYQQQRLLVASSPTGVTLVSHLPDNTTPDLPPSPASAFTEKLRQAVTRNS